MSDGFPYADPKQPGNFAYRGDDEIGAGVLAWIKARDRAVLASEIEDAFGQSAFNVITGLQRAGKIRAVFPESKPGDSGRQFWEIVPC